MFIYIIITIFKVMSSRLFSNGGPNNVEQRKVYVHCTRFNWHNIWTRFKSDVSAQRSLRTAGVRDSRSFANYIVRTYSQVAGLTGRKYFSAHPRCDRDKDRVARDSVSRGFDDNHVRAEFIRYCNILYYTLYTISSCPGCYTWRSVTWRHRGRWARHNPVRF